jgi:signal transduction histidine kinase
MAMAAGALLLMVIVGISTWSALRAADDVDKGIRSFLIRSLTRDVVDAVIGAESSQRGYLLTGKDFYLAPYRANVSSLPDMLRRLHAAIPDNPDLPPLQAAIDEKMSELAATVDLATHGRKAEALALVMSDKGQRTMDRVRTMAATMIGRQKDRLLADLDRSRASVRVVIAVDLAAATVLAFLVGVIIVGVNRYVSRMREAGAALKSAHDELAARRPILEAAVAARTAELSRANDELQRFAYIVSHDLRAPLLNIIGFTSELDHATRRLNDYVTKTMAEGGAAVPEDVRLASEEDLPEAIGFIRTSTTKMDRLINAILKLSREGRRLLTPELLDMNALVAELAGSLQHQVEEAGAEVRIGRLPSLTCDRTAMDQVFSNLLENALKYTAAGRPPVIEVAGRTHLDGAGRRVASYTVSDNGRGIAERDMERIFELFRRAGVQDRPGEGIGLAHVRALVRRLGGDISCSSTPDVGTIFTLTLPIVFSAAGGQEG